MTLTHTHISVFSWKQVWQHGKAIHKYLQTIVSICSCFFLHGGVLKICPEKGFVCGLTTFIVEIRISRWLCRIRVSKWTSLDVACFRDAYRCWTMELIYLYSMESSQQWQMTQAHLDFFCSRFLAFRCSQPWGLPCLGLGFWSHVRSRCSSLAVALFGCVLPCEDIQLVQIPYRWLHLSFFGHLCRTCQAGVSRFHDTNCSSSSTVGGITRRT